MASSNSSATQTKTALPLRSIQNLVVPRHLDGFQLAFGRLLGIVLELGEFGHITMQVGEPHCQGIEFGVVLRKQNPDVHSVIPGEIFGHESFLRKLEPLASSTWHLASGAHATIMAMG